MLSRCGLEGVSVGRRELLPQVLLELGPEALQERVLARAPGRARGSGGGRWLALGASFEGSGGLEAEAEGRREAEAADS